MQPNPSCNRLGYAKIARGRFCQIWLLFQTRQEPKRQAGELLVGLQENHAECIKKAL